MRLRRFIESAALVAACVGSGSLECGGPVSTAAEHRGASTYRRMCAVCHGADGEGYKADEATALANPAFLVSVSDSFLRRTIVEGRAGTTMSAWGQERGGPLAPGDVDAIIELLHSWRRPGARPVLDEGALAGDANRGEAVFAKECSRCHGRSGTGGPYVNIGAQDFLAIAGNGYMRYAIRGGRSGTAMPAFAASIGNRDIEDALTWIRSLQRGAPPASRAAPARVPPLPLGPVPLNPRGPEPVGFKTAPGTTPAEVIHQQLQRGARMALLDARAPSDYAFDHIANAVSVPFYDIDPYVDALPRDAWLVCYCACPHAESGQLAQKLQSKGFTKVAILDEGLGVWRSRQYGTHTGWDP